MPNPQTAETTMPTDAEAPVLRLQRRFNASPAVVWRAFTEAEALRQWFGPEGFTVHICEVDLRVGGRYRIGMRSPEGSEHIVGGVFRAIAAPERLVYSFAWEGEDPGPETEVTLEFVAQGNATELRLTQTGFASVESRDAHQGGWSSSFTCLEQAIAKGALA
jgi:uncharacterized protein YndB with AHSA1/START domain